MSWVALGVHRFIFRPICQFLASLRHFYAQLNEPKISQLTDDREVVDSKQLKKFDCGGG